MGQRDHPMSHPTSPTVLIFSLLYILSYLVTPKLAKSNNLAVDSSEEVTSFIPSFPLWDWLEMTEVVMLNINTYPLVVFYTIRTHIYPHTGSLNLNTEDHDNTQTNIHSDIHILILLPRMCYC